MKTISVSRRGCGYPKKGGFYAIGGGPAMTCFALPVELQPCTCCDQLPMFSRAPQKVQGKYMAQLFGACPCGSAKCVREHRTYWLSFVGSDYTAKEFNDEIKEQGMSRRIQPSFAKAIKPGDIFANVKGMKILNLIPVTSVRYYVKDEDDVKKVTELEAAGIEVCKMSEETEIEAAAEAQKEDFPE